MGRVGNTSTTVQGSGEHWCARLYIFVLTHMWEGRTRAELDAGNATWLSTYMGNEAGKFDLTYQNKDEYKWRQHFSVSKYTNV